MTRARSRAPARKPSPPTRGRKPGQTTPAIAAAARKAGKSGGRPRDAVPEDVLLRIGPPPTDENDPNKIRMWNARLIAEIAWLSIAGKVGPTLAETARANSSALERALPSRPPAGGWGDGEDGDTDEDSDDEESPGVELEDVSHGPEPIGVGG